MSIETANLDKSLEQILKDKYVIPLYQRNFAWKEEQITKFLQDIYGAFQKNNRGNYFIGTLTVLKRKNGDYEIIDGQQRFTVITLLSKILDISKEPKIFYDSRPEVENFFKSFYNDDSYIHTEKIRNLIYAIDYIKETELNPNEEDKLTIKSNKDQLFDFIKFVTSNVKWVVAEIPDDTDVAAYFEIMNNRGEQLQKHELLKSRMMDTIDKKDHKSKAVFSKIWDACSQMDIPIQDCFTQKNAVENGYRGDRKVIFGDQFDNLNINDISNLEVNCEESNDGYTIADILNDKINDFRHNYPFNNSVNQDENGKKITYYSIIDFPNFLMYVLKICFNDQLNENQKVPLNEKELLTAFDNIKSTNACKFNAITFIKELLTIRFIFDRYIIRAGYSEESGEDVDRWYLVKPRKSNDGNNKLYYVNTFGKEREDEREEASNDDLIKPISMLQVTYRSRIYKDWLFEILKWLKSENNLTSIDDTKYVNKLNSYIIACYKNLDIEILRYDDAISNVDDLYSCGTRTPHFVFNFIDYLYWLKDKNQYKFDFKYRNSVEHHYPQSGKDIDTIIKDNLGNLCLVSKGANSKMSNENPVGKAAKTGGKYYNDALPPKQKVMYDLTNKNNQWAQREMLEHYNDIANLLSKDSLEKLCKI